MYRNEVYTYFVSGKAYVRAYGDPQAYEWPGLIDQVTLAIAQQVIQLPNRATPGGGNYDEIRRIESVTATLNCREFRPSMLARALFGTLNEVPAGSVVEEEHVATLGGFLPLAHPGAYTAVSVTMDDTPKTAVAQAGNYEVQPGGILILEDAADLDDDDELLVSYSHPAYDRVQGITAAAPLLEIMFVGQNEARGNKEVRVKMHRVRLGPAAEKALLSGDDFGALQLEGEVLQDSTIVTAGISQYFFEDVAR